MSTSIETKASQLEKLLNTAVETVVEDLFSDLKRKKQLVDVSNAQKIKETILGRASMPDYPDL